jgi:hypothetical protein
VYISLYLRVHLLCVSLSLRVAQCLSPQCHSHQYLFTQSVIVLTAFGKLVLFLMLSFLSRKLRLLLGDSDALQRVLQEFNQFEIAPDKVSLIPGVGTPVWVVNGNRNALKNGFQGTVHFPQRKDFLRKQACLMVLCTCRGAHPLFNHLGNRSADPSTGVTIHSNDRVSFSASSARTAQYVYIVMLSFY